MLQNPTADPDKNTHREIPTDGFSTCDYRLFEQRTRELIWFAFILSATVGMPKRLSPPSFFGIATMRTGGGKYVPDDMRFQIL
jgi:hypothetical protein